MCTHDDDPIPKFGVSLLVQAPTWLKRGVERAPTILRIIITNPFTFYTDYGGRHEKCTQSLFLVNLWQLATTTEQILPTLFGQYMTLPFLKNK